VVQIIEKKVYNAILSLKMEVLRPLMLIFVYYQLVEDHILRDYNLRKLDFQQINMEELTLIKHGKLPFHIFMLLVMLLKVKCLLIKPKKKVLPLLNT